MYRRLIKRVQEVAQRFFMLRLLGSLTVVWLLLAAGGAAVLWFGAQAQSFSPWSGPLLALIGLSLAVVGAVFAVYSARSTQWVVERIEEQFPELDSRLRTAVEQQPELPMGRLGFLQESVVRETLEHNYKHPWTRVVPVPRLALMHLLHAAGLVAAIYVVTQVVIISDMKQRALVEIRPQFSSLGERIASNIVVEPGNTELERGTSLLVLARFQGPLPDDAQLVIHDQDDKIQRLPMSRSMRDPVFATRVPDVRNDLRYRVEFAGQTTDVYSVSVFEFPELVRVDAKLEFPEYTGLKTTVVEETRRITAVEGTSFTLMCHLNKQVARAWFESESEGETVELTPMKGIENAVSAQFVLKQSRRFRLHLVDAKERHNKVPPEIVINVVPNQPPDLALDWPRRDVQVSPLEELKLKAKATDDFGVRRIGVAYHLAGDDAKEVVLAADVKADQESAVDHVVFFEDLKAKPDQLLSYYFWAEDTGPDGADRRVFSDMYFAEVRRFEEIFRQGQQPPNGANQQQQQQQQQANQNAQQAERMAESQKQIINATWKVIRRETASEPSSSFVSDVKLLEDSQLKVLEQVDQLAGNVQDPESVRHVAEVKDLMREAAQHLAAAGSGQSLGPLQPALAAEQSAYQALLRLRAREHEVVRQQQQQQQQSSSSSSQNRNRQQLDQLEMKQAENRYETQKQAEQQQQQRQQQAEAQREVRQVLNRLRELARRQADLNKRMKELQSALEAAETEEEEEDIRRQLKRLRDEEQRILQDLDELDERMQRADNRREMRDEQKKLQEARENVREAAKALDQEELSQAVAEGARAGQRFEDLKEKFRQRTSGQFDEQMKEMRQAAQELEDRQNEIGEQIAKSNETQTRSLRADPQREALQRKVKDQKDKLDKLLDEVKRTVQDAESSEPLLSKRLYETWRKAQQSKVDNAIDVTRQLLDRGFWKEAEEAEQVAREGVQQFNQGIQRAAESVLGGEAEAMSRAESELQQLAQQLNEEVDANDPQARANQQRDGQPRDGQPRDGQQRDGQQREGQQREGQQREGQQRDGQQREGQPREGQEREGQERDGQQREGQQRDGQQRDGQQRDGQQRDGQQRDGQQREGQQREGQERDGQQREGQQRDGQQRDGQPRERQQRDGQQRDGQQREGQQRDGQQREGQQREGQQRNGQQSGRQNPRSTQSTSRQSNGRGGLTELFQDGNVPDRPLTGSGFREWSDRLRDVEEMLNDPELRNEVARVRDRARNVRADFKRHSKEPKWPLVREQIAKPLNELLERVSEEVAKKQSPDQRRPIDRDPVPDEFSERVRKYFEQIGKGN